MKLKWIFIAGLLALNLGCQVTREFSGIESETEIADYPLENMPTDTLSMAEMTIREFFDDPLLLDLIHAGLTRNYNLAQAYKAVDIAHSFYEQGKAAYTPTLSVGPAITYSLNSKNSQFGAIEGASRIIQNYRLGFNASWEADVWGKLKSQEKMAFEDLQAAQVGIQGIQTELVSNIASLYYQLVALDARRGIALETIRNRRTSLETIEALKSAGMVTEVAVQQNRAQLHSAEFLLVGLEESIFLLENTLNAILARPYQPIERILLNDIRLPESFGTGVPGELLVNRPDLRQAEHQIRGDFEQINIAKTFFYPALVLNGSAGLESINIGKFFSPASLFANVAGGLTRPLLDRRQNKTRLEVSEYQLEQSMLHYENLYINAVKEVTEALMLAEKADEKLDINLKSLSAVTSALNFSEELLNHGRANYLEVLVAQDQVLATELGLVDSRLQRISAMVSLYKALGGGWRID